MPIPMQDDEIVLSPAKYQELEAELERLQTVERRQIAERIKEARAMGDLSENFDYHDAKRQQGFLEGKIVGLKQTLERAKIADYVSGSDIVTLGSVVKVHDAEFDEDIEYTIVGVMEADPATTRSPTRPPSARRCSATRSATASSSRPPPASASWKSSRCGDKCLSYCRTAGLQRNMWLIERLRVFRAQSVQILRQSPKPLPCPLTSAPISGSNTDCAWHSVPRARQSNLQAVVP